MFRFIGTCDDKQLRKKLFELKRKDATAVRDAIAQHDMQLKAEDILGTKSVAAVKSNQNKQVRK